MISTLPQDPVILLSFINTRLRDNYATLDSLCKDMDVDRSELESRLDAIGYKYDSAINKFV